METFWGQFSFSFISRQFYQMAALPRIMSVIIISLFLFATYAPMTSAKSLLHTPTHIVQNTIYLPIVVTVPKVSPYLFRTDDSCTGDTFSEPVQSGSILASGFKRLKSNVLIQGGVGRQWSQTWSLNGQTQASLTKSGLITQENEVLNFTFWYGEDGNCGDNVPAGTWDVTFMLNGAVFQTGRVVIQ